MALRVIASLSSLVFLLSLISFAAMGTSEECKYSVKVKTGDVPKGGTDSKITLTLVSCTDKTFKVDDLKTWGTEGPDFDYFKKGQLAEFSGTGRCLDVCAMTISSSSTATGKLPGWYLEHVEVTVGDSPDPISFPVYRWLAKDEPPNDLSANVDLCSCFKAKRTPANPEL